MYIAGCETDKVNIPDAAVVDMTEVTVSLIDTTEGVDVTGITILPPMLDTMLR